MHPAEPLVEQIREEIKEREAGQHFGSEDYARCGGIALAILNMTVGESHPLHKQLEHAIQKDATYTIIGLCSSIVVLYDKSTLIDMRAKIAADIEGDFLDVAEQQWKDASANAAHRAFHLAIAAFLAGAVLEDGLRRTCDKHGITYDPANSKISVLINLLYAPSKQTEHISKGEHKQITAWGETRNNADHGHFDKLELTEVQGMISGVRAFIAKHLSP